MRVGAFAVLLAAEPVFTAGTGAAAATVAERIQNWLAGATCPDIGRVGTARHHLVLGRPRASAEPLSGTSRTASSCSQKQRGDPSHATVGMHAPGFAHLLVPTTVQPGRLLSDEGVGRLGHPMRFGSSSRSRLLLRLDRGGCLLRCRGRRLLGGRAGLILRFRAGGFLRHGGLSIATFSRTTHV